jgi:hypothetical protein
MPETRLRVEPLLGTSKLAFARQVVVSQRVIHLYAATPTHRHPPVGLGKVVLVEPGTYLSRFK